MTQLEEHANKLSNTLRLVGVFLVTVSVVALVAISGTDQTNSSILLGFLLCLAVSGIVGLTISSALWRLILKYGISEQRMLYFYDPELKRYR